MTTTNPELQLFSVYQPPVANGWLMSDWTAGQTPIMNWEDQNVRKTATGVIELALTAAAAGSARAFNGAEVQSSEVATTGTWSWTAQAPKMVDGAVFGMFTYRADWQLQPWVEFDFEFVGKDTTKVQLNIHMEDAFGRHISLDQAKGGPIIVDLGFDASQGMNTYDVVVSDNSATFRVNGKVVGVYGASDMPGGIWQIGPQKSYVDLWCASGLESWTGQWAYDGSPLVAKLQGADVRGGDLNGLTPRVTGDGVANALVGSSSDDYIAGLGGNDTLSGAAGNDTLLGGEGDDKLRLESGNDLLDGSNGLDWVELTGTVKGRVDLEVTAAQDTGFGMDTLRNIENFSGGGGNDVAFGTAGANALHGNVGNDNLSGRDGNDTLFGGSGDDTLNDGVGNDQLFGGDGSDRLVLAPGDDLMDGASGADWVIVGSGTAGSVNLTLTTAQNTGYGFDTIRNIEHVQGNSGHDRLTGNTGANLLLGGAGNDTLSGGFGNDTLTGGEGADQFLFRSTANGTDSITDFNQLDGGAAERDLLRLEGPALGTFAYLGTGAFTGGLDHTEARVSGNQVLVDRNGDGMSDLSITLIGLTSATQLRADDFLFL